MGDHQHAEPDETRLRHRSLSQTGTLPGSLVADPDAKQSIVRIMAYDSDGVVDQPIDSVDELGQYRDKHAVLWVDVEGLGDIGVIRQIGQLFDIHGLSQEDILNTEHRPKLEQYGDRLFLVLRESELKQELVSEQICLFFGKGFVVTFRERSQVLVEPVRHRIRNKVGLIRDLGADYLVYTIIDLVIDSYFPVLETLGERLELLEAEIIDQPSRQSVSEIHAVKRDLLTMRRAMWPMREAVNSLIREGPPLILEESVIHLRDCYDHAVQIIDFIETYRELGADLMDLYLSSMSNRMNEVMKVLTIITTVFVPPTFIAGIYGMNFRPEVSPWNMPELKWYYGYPLALGIMLVVALAVLSMLWWKGWLAVLSPIRNRRLLRTKRMTGGDGVKQKNG